MPENNFYFDTHCHIDLTLQRGVNLELIKKNLLENNTQTVIQIASDPDSIKFSPDFCRLHSDGVQYYYTIGLHPNEAHELDVDFGIEAIHCNSQDERFVGVGEIGLDYYYGPEHRDLQIATFEKYLSAAKKFNKPVIIHTRNAHEDTVSLLKKSGINKILIHCFTGNTNQMNEYLDLGAYISFSGIVTFKNAADVQQAARECPRDRILIETDSPYLAPAPYRGQVNLPGYVRHVGEFISNIRQENLTQNFLANANRFFFKK
jgi:TatD DNase family protein